jgi:hypothetical protein
MSFENAVNIYTKENAPRVSLDGKLVYVYSAGYVYDVAMGVKHHDPEAIKEMATELSNMIDEDCFLVPAPQHTGKAEYTLEICKIIERINPHNITILDVLSCEPRDTLYDMKKKVKKITKDTKFSSGIMLKEALADIEGPIYFVDNIIATGTTLRDAQQLIPNIRPLVFAASRRYFER